MLSLESSGGSGGSLAAQDSLGQSGPGHEGPWLTWPLLAAISTASLDLQDLSSQLSSFPLSL